jgi:aminoglycoside phosphotransferase (APT) family kinase protein
MNPETTLTNEQITELFIQNNLNLSANPTINRIKIGFTNEVHEVDHYILKVYVRPLWEEYFKKESRLYKSLYGKIQVPKVIVSDGTKTILDKPYMIYEKIEGNPLGGQWHRLNNDQRKAIIEALCKQLKLIRSSEPSPQLTPPSLTWQNKTVDEIEKHLVKVEKEQLLSSEIIDKIHSFISSFKNVLKPQTLGLMYWDTHFDNIIVNNEAEIVGLIDFEHVDVVSVDFLLIIVRNMMKYPHIMLSESEERYAKKEDYQHLEGWYKKFYPELFAFDDLERRIDFYDLSDILRMLPRFPKAQQLHDRLSLILS